MVAVFFTTIGGFLASNPDNLFKVKRDFDIEVMYSGYKFAWQNIERPEYSKYRPEEKNEPFEN